MKYGFFLNLKRLVITGLLVAASPAQASLGGGIDSIESDSVKTHAKHIKRATTGDFTVHDVTSDSREVKEYVNAQGVVFAVTWTGALPPDLSQLFGSYYSEFQSQKAKSIRRRGARNQTLNSSHLSVNIWGHQRSMKGRAILTSAVPASVQEGDIK